METTLSWEYPFCTMSCLSVCFFTINDEVRLKQIELSDAYSMYALINTQRDYLSRWLPFVDEIHSIADIELYIQMLLTAPESRYEYGFVLQKEGMVIGGINFKDTDRDNQKSEIGYWIAQEHQKKGWVTQAVDKLCNWGFTQLGLHRIQIKCAVQNIRSRKVAERLGFRLEGIEREGERLSENQFTDLAIYGLLKKEYCTYHDICAL